MESVDNIKCKWKTCSAAAVRHAVFSDRAFEPQSSESSKLRYDGTAEHYDLCERHVKSVRDQYLNVRVYELGRCPKHPIRERSG